MEVLDLEKKLIEVLRNFTLEETQFLIHIEPALFICKNETNLNSQEEIITYLTNEGFKTAVVKEYQNKKELFNNSLGNYLENETNEIGNYISKINTDIEFFNNKIKSKELEINQIQNSYNREQEVRYFASDKLKLQNNISLLENAKKNNLLFIENYQKLIEDTITIEKFDCDEYEKAINNISYITLNKEFEYLLRKNDFNIELDNWITNKHSFLYSEISNYQKSFYEFSKLLYKNFKPNPNIIPINWKKHLNYCITNIDSSFENCFLNESFISNQNKISITPFDYSYFIALRNSLIQKEFITANNIIYLPLSGGIMAQIVFKYYSFSNEKVLCFTNGKQENRELNNKSNAILYKNSESLTIQVPNGYLFLYNNLWCEIKFHSAPVLFENSTLKFNGIIAEEDYFDDDEDAAYYSKKRR